MKEFLHRICMASDFFYPNAGGVEEHIFNLSQCLMAKGHKVIVLTHCYQDRVGIRYMKNGLKVYYLPIRTFYNQCVLPSMICSLPLIRYILLCERITLVHGHSAFSTLAHETILIGNLLGLATIFTDHSLFGFADASAIITNKFLEISLANVGHCICVSHIGKENTVLRAKVRAEDVSVIPNAVDTNLFKPDCQREDWRDGERIKIVVVSRLVYRKGTDLLAKIIPNLCNKYSEVDFIIGGDGPKRTLLEELREGGLADRVTLLGSLEHRLVRDVLVQGHIFLNTSITEAYCMAIVEAAACGLLVVSTNVGGIPEVLPSELVYLTDPNVSSLLIGLETAIAELRRGRRLSPQQIHERVKPLYDWQDVTRRTEIVYSRGIRNSNFTLREQLKRYALTGIWPWLLVVTLCFLMLKWLDWYVPKKEIDFSVDFPCQQTNHIELSTKEDRKK